MGKRWNGWGSADVAPSLSAEALAFLASRVGTAQPASSITRDAAVRSVGVARLPSASPLSTDADVRLDHAYGQSLSDWITLRTGLGLHCADGVALPETAEDVRAALAAARRAGAIVIPYGGGTSVAGHLAVPRSDRPVVNISLEKLRGLRTFDGENLVATFGAGTPGPMVEAELRAHGCTLGHFPQSFELSTVGGWVATRSSGQQSLRYGRIEQLLQQAQLVTPVGAFTVGGAYPASSAGPDLREVVLGSEGRLGLLTDVTLRVRRLPEHESFHASFFPSWDAGVLAVRALVQDGVPLSMLRLSNPLETITQLALADGHARSLAWLTRYLGWRGVGDGRCLLIVGVTGGDREVSSARGALAESVARHGGVRVGTSIGASWARGRFRGPYLRNALWDAGYAVDTFETAVPWSRATETMNGIELALRTAMDGEGERAHVFTHLSHVYRSGCSVYVTCVFRLASAPDATLARWQRLKRAASTAVVAAGGTISHQHGVGSDHAPWLEAEKGAQGMGVLRAIARELDPDEMMNPGKLFT